MIVKYPTGLYRSVLPRGTGPGNVTFTVSGSAPPRTALLFPKLPPGVGSKPRPTRVVPATARRAAVDELIYTTSRSGRAVLGTIRPQYEIGQVLGFDEPGAPPPTAELLLAGAEGEVRHDTGLLDYDRLGIPVAQRAGLLERAAAEYTACQDELSRARQEHLGLQVVIGENQKSINEATKAISALAAIGDPDLAPTLALLESKRAALQSERGGAINRANELAREAERLRSKLLDLSQLVR